MSQGRLAYIHIPDMGAEGYREFIKWWYPQVRKEGLVVDVRDNGGGNISQTLIERLSRTLHGTGFQRNREATATYPRVVQPGPKAALINEDTASDGDIGVDPDIVVEQDPVEVLKGHDPQLERAVEELMKLLPATPGALPRRPAPPNKNQAQ